MIGWMDVRGMGWDGRGRNAMARGMERERVAERARVRALSGVTSVT